MITAAGIIAACAGFALVLWWMLGRPMRGCVCGRCRKRYTPLPRCRLSGSTTSAWLAFRSGPMAGRSVKLLSPQLSVGSVASNDVVLSDPAVSEQHLVILCPGDRFVARDQGSTNGVYVNGVRVKKFVLASDDILTIGNSEAVFRFL